MIFTCIALLFMQYEFLLSSFKSLLVIIRIHLLVNTPPVHLAAGLRSCCIKESLSASIIIVRF